MFCVSSLLLYFLYDNRGYFVLFLLPKYIHTHSWLFSNDSLTRWHWYVTPGKCRCTKKRHFIISCCLVGPGLYMYNIYKVFWRKLNWGRPSSCNKECTDTWDSKLELSGTVSCNSDKEKLCETVKPWERRPTWSINLIALFLLSCVVCSQSS